MHLKRGWRRVQPRPPHLDSGLGLAVDQRCLRLVCGQDRDLGWLVALRDEEANQLHRSITPGFLEGTQILPTRAMIVLSLSGMRRLQGKSDSFGRQSECL